MRSTLYKATTQHDSTSQSGVIGREWQSEMTLLGLPLVHIVSGRKSDGKQLKAKGIVAIGQFATGGLCISQFGTGLVCVSQFSISVLSLAQFSLAAITIAQFGICLDGIGQTLMKLLPFI